jgi:transcriptional regulator with XRE-family HTH domain
MNKSKLTILRRTQGLSQTDLAVKANVSTAQVNRMENGYRPGKSEALKRIAKVLNVDVDELHEATSEEAAQAERLRIIANIERNLGFQPGEILHGKTERGKSFRDSILEAPAALAAHEAAKAHGDTE